MPPKFTIQAAVLAISLLGLSGCATSRPPRPPPKPVEAEVINPPPLVENGLLQTDAAVLAAVESKAEATARFAAGFSHELKGEGDEAFAEYCRAAFADPGNEPLVLEVTTALVQRKDSEKALALLAKATAIPQASGVVLAQQGWALLQAGKTNEALAAYAQARRRSPRSILICQNLVSLQLQAQQPKEALKVLEEAAKLPEAEAEYLVALADLYRRFVQQAPKEGAVLKPRAVELLNRARALKPQTAAVTLKLADTYDLLGESKLAVEVYLQMLERFASHPPLRDGIREKLTSIYLRGKDHQRAAEQLEAIVRDYPTHPQAYFYLGSLAFETNDFAKAIEYFNKTVLLDPDFEAVYYEIAGAQINARQPEEALRTLERARVRFPKDNFVREFYTALAYTRQKDYGKALRAFTAAEVMARATETNRLTPVFYFQLGAAHERHKQYGEAEHYFQKCLQLAPDFSEALNYLGYMWAERGVHLEKAKALIEKAVKLEPKNAAFLDSLGWVYYRLDQPKTALEYLRQAIQYSEKPDPTLLDHLGDIHAALKQWDKAREAWRKSLELEPNEEIQKKLDRPAGAAPAP